MKPVESCRKRCLAQQTRLRGLMMNSGQHNKAIELFLSQHAMLHSAKMAHTETWSFEDEVLNDLTEAQIRQIPSGADHSVAWLIWHMTRCEDITDESASRRQPANFESR